MNIFIVIPFFLSYLYLIWFDTEAFIEYAKVFQLRRFSETIDSFIQGKEDGGETSFINYLIMFHDSFWVKLITCPVCLNTWISILAGGILTYIIYQHDSTYGLIEGILYTCILPYINLFLYKLLKRI